MSACVFTNKSPGSSARTSSGPEYKNHGQQRKAEVHERNAARKAAKDAEKADKKKK